MGAMTRKLRPAGLGSGIDRDRPDDTVVTASGRSGALIRPAAVRQTALILGDECQVQ